MHRVVGHAPRSVPHPHRGQGGQAGGVDGRHLIALIVGNPDDVVRLVISHPIGRGDRADGLNDAVRAGVYHRQAVTPVIGYVGPVPAGV